MNEFTIEELRAKTDPEVLDAMHPRQKLALMDELLESFEVMRQAPLSQARLDLSQAHVIAIDGVQSSILRDPR